MLDNWKYSGGIDEFVDWSSTSPRRERTRPADTVGDTAIHVHPVPPPSSQHVLSAPDHGFRFYHLESALALGRLDLCAWSCPQEYDQETKDYEVARHALFWSDDGSKTLYKNHVK